MIITFGTQTKRIPIGYAAAFCPICRGLAIVSVEEARRQNQVYQVGVGEGWVAGYVYTCHRCHSFWGLQPDIIPATISPDTLTTMDDLVVRTFPTFYSVYAERLQQEETIRRDPFALSPDVRFQLLSEPFFVLENEMQIQQSRDNSSGMGCLFGFLGAILFAVLAFCGFVLQKYLFGAGSLLLMFGSGWFCYRAFTAGESKEFRQFMNQRFYPCLSTCLAPLRPTEEELTEVLANAKTVGAKYTKKKELLAAIQNVPTASNPPIPDTR